MTTFFVLISSLWARILALFDAVVFELRIYGQTINISLLAIILAFLVFSILINVFWKGARA